MSEQKKIVSLSMAQKKIAGAIDIGGVAHDVLQLTFGANQKLQTATDLGAILDVVRIVCPTLTDEITDGMTLEDAKLILRFAAAGVEAVAEMFPNAVSPEIPTSPG